MVAQACSLELVLLVGINAPRHGMGNRATASPEHSGSLCRQF